MLGVNLEVKGKEKEELKRKEIAGVDGWGKWAEAKPQRNLAKRKWGYEDENPEVKKGLDCRKGKKNALVEIKGNWAASRCQKFGTKNDVLIFDYLIRLLDRFDLIIRDLIVRYLIRKLCLINIRDICLESSSAMWLGQWSQSISPCLIFVTSKLQFVQEKVETTR